MNSRYWIREFAKVWREKFFEQWYFVSMKRKLRSHFPLYRLLWHFYWTERLDLNERIASFSFLCTLFPVIRKQFVNYLYDVKSTVRIYRFLAELTHEILISELLICRYIGSLFRRDSRLRRYESKHLFHWRCTYIGTRDNLRTLIATV